jgi:PilZ domain
MGGDDFRHDSSIPILPATVKSPGRSADEKLMQRRLHDRAPADFEVRVTAVKNRECSGSGRVADISKSGVCVFSPVPFGLGDAVQLDMANSTLFGHVAYCNPEGALFRTGVEIVQVLLGGTDLSKLLQTTLEEMMPGTPGVQPSEIRIG